MQITSIEVIRGNPSNPEVIGIPAGEKLPVAVGVLAGERIELTYGQSLRVNVSFDYQGLAGSATLYGSIGSRDIFGFGEILHNDASIELPESPTEFTSCQRSVDISITSGISPGTDYDLYVKLLEYSEAGISEEDDVIDIVGLPPVYELIQHTIYHFAYIYDGNEEVTTATFKTDPFTPSAWMADKFANKLEEEVRARGGHPLEVKVYVDKTPLLWTNFRIEVSSTPIGGVAEASPGIAFGIPIWAAILIACLAITLVIVVATLAFKTVMAEFKRKPGLEDVKPAWGKEALILDIQDAEEYWERPLTPVETLEGMSEEELRVHLDKIAEEEVPPVEISPWVALALVGGLGILGVGVAVALAARRKE